MGRRTGTAAFLACLLVLAGTAAGSAPMPPSTIALAAGVPSATPVTTVLSLVGVGDSVPAGDECDGCMPFVELFGRRLAQDRASDVVVSNLGVGGFTSADLLDSLADDEEAVTVGDADVVIVTIGANDFAPILDAYFDGGCEQDCRSSVAPELEHLRATLIAILQRLVQLRAGRAATVLVTGYWNVFPDGQVALEQYGPGFEAVSADLTHHVDTVIEEVTSSQGATYVDLLHAFKGTDGESDPTELLADDGDHPNQAGHEKICDALSAAVPLPRAAPTGDSGSETCLR